MNIQVFFKKCTLIFLEDVHIKLKSWLRASQVLPVECSFLDTSACGVSLCCSGEQGVAENGVPVFSFCVSCLDKLSL